VCNVQQDSTNKRVVDELCNSFVCCNQSINQSLLAEAMVTPRRKCRRPAMVTPKSYPYP